MTLKNIIVIGASRGIGVELVHQFAQNPSHHVWAFSRDLAGMQEKFKGLENVSAFALDVASAEVKPSSPQVTMRPVSVRVCVSAAVSVIGRFTFI